HPVPRSLPGIRPGMATGFFHRRAGPNGLGKTAAATPERLSWACYARKTENRKPKTENRKLYTANSICLFSVTALNIPSVFIRLEAAVWERAMPANARQRRANEHQRRIGGFNNPNRDKNVTPTNPAQPLRFYPAHSLQPAVEKIR